MHEPAQPPCTTATCHDPPATWTRKDHDQREGIPWGAWVFWVTHPNEARSPAVAEQIHFQPRVHCPAEISVGQPDGAELAALLSALADGRITYVADLCDSCHDDFGCYVGGYSHDNPETASLPCERCEGGLRVVVSVAADPRYALVRELATNHIAGMDCHVRARAILEMEDER